MRKIRSTRGFTLIEIIAVLVLIGILAAVAIARATDNTANEVAAANTLKTHLRYAQALAMNSDTVWGVEGTGSSSYQLYYFGTIGENGTVGKIPARFPGENTDTVNLSRVSITPNFDVSFNGWGSPTSETTIVVGSQTITITPETGFIP